MSLSTLLLLSTLGVGAPSMAQAPDPFPEGLYARVHTTRGDITLRLEPDRAPLATAAFVGLAEGTIENAAFPLGRPYYDGTAFHRVVPGHVIQAGAPDTEAASGPGWVYPNEIHADLSHGRAGVLGVANGGPHTNSGQFYITLDDRSYLDGDYIVLGEVVEGMEVVFGVEQGDVVDSVRVVRVGERARTFRPESAAFRAMIRRAEARVAEHEELRSEAWEAWLAEHVRGAGGEAGEVRTAPRGSAAALAMEPAPRPVAGPEGQARYRGVALRYVGHLLGHTGPPLQELHLGSGPDGRPGFFDPPRAFPVGDEGPNINAGLDRVLARLGPGEGIVAVIPPALGYGSGGHYGPDRPGERRFVISPGSLLVYEVEILPAGR
jgi:cyclophilin family peptidyl-prolyl cis-trans isomerase